MLYAMMILGTIYIYIVNTYNIDHMHILIIILYRLKDYTITMDNRRYTAHITHHTTPNT